MTISHAKLSASGSARWILCPGSVAKTRNYSDTTSPSALIGTCAHELADICLKTFNSPFDYVGKTLSDAPEVIVDNEMAEYVESYVAYCRELGGDAHTEERVSYTDYVPEGFGTADFFTMTDVKGVSTCDIVDLKFGIGVHVFAEENTQAMIYALGVLQNYDFMYSFDVFRLHIYQPRIDNISVWEISRDKLEKWGEWLKGRAQLALSDNAPLSAGEKQCRWCAHKPNCLELYHHTASVIGCEFEALDEKLPAPESVDFELVLSNKTLIESWLSAVEKQAAETLLNGGEVTGYKLVAGRSRRVWQSEDAAIALLSDELGENLYTKKLISAPQAEKLVGKAKFSELYGELVIKPEGKATLAPISDKRQAINKSIDTIKNNF